MSFISYAQNFEDVILYRALKHIDTGFYIDVGAAWPSADSVTQAFYDRGWSGINVEPNPELYMLLVQQRERDVNVQMAIGSSSGQSELHVIPQTGLSTLDQSIAARHLRSGWSTASVTVRVISLAELWDTHVPPGRQVHFLKVDVEGYEATVLASADWLRHRPWVVVVEATVPSTQDENHDKWEPALLQAGYLLVYRDGLNRFYLAQEHADLSAAFDYPPNVFDRFMPRAHVDALAAQKALFDRLEAADAALVSERTHLTEKADMLSASLQDLQAQNARLATRQSELEQAVSDKQTQAEHWLAVARQREQLLETIESSWSWRIGSPFRRWKRSYQKRRAKLSALWNRHRSKPSAEVAVAPRRESWGSRTFKRWQNSFRKRFGRQRAQRQLSATPTPEPVVMSKALHPIPTQLALQRQLRVRHISSQSNANNRFE